MQPRGSVQSLYVAGRDQPFVWIANYDLFLRGDELRSAVTAIVAHFLMAVSLDDLGIVHVATKGAFHRSHISVKAIGGDLHPVCHALGHVLHKGLDRKS